MSRASCVSVVTLFLCVLLTSTISVQAGDEDLHLLSDPDSITTSDLTAEYDGELAYLLEAGLPEPLSLAAADFDEDGVPDLVVGYGDGASGLFVVHRGNLEAIYPKPGMEAGQAFRPEAQVFSAAQRVDHLGSGDFDADGHFDVVLASSGGTILELYRGDGRGGFAAVEAIDLGGRLTALAVGEVNRRDGLADVVVGVMKPSGPRILVYESPVGALHGSPEAIDVLEQVTSIELGNFDDDYCRDIAAATESYRINVAGRDRRLSLGRKQRAEVAEAKVLTESAAASSHAIKNTRVPLADVFGGEIHAHLSMRLNRDVFPDTIAIIEGSPKPVVVKTLSRATFTVDSTADDGDFDTGDGVCDTDDSVGDGPCTLRAAIEQANASSGADAIEFDIAGTGPHTIQPLTQLPTITEALTIDGTTEPDFGGTPVIELDGSAAPGAMNGLVVTAGSSVIRGLAINRMQRAGSVGHGIYLDVNGGNIIEGNFLGTDTNGTTALPNEYYGIFGYNGAGNVYGGTAAPARNLISGQFLDLAHREGNGALIRGNYIGTDISGTISLQQYGASGVHLFSRENFGASPGDDHTVGGTTAGAGNLISGLHTGIELGLDTSGNLIQGNLIGTDPSGTLPLPISNWGIKTYQDENNTIGGTSPAARNVISVAAVSWMMALFAQDSPGILVQGNYIGTDIAGTSGLPCSWGIRLQQTLTGAVIGGAVPGAGNLIAGCLEHGVFLRDVSNVTIQGNAIGVDSTGAPMGNGLAGIIIHRSDNVTIGGTGPGEGNTIAHNGGNGVEIGGAGNVSDPGIEVVGNTIHSNTGLGIDIEDDGVTPNDAGDADTGSNGWQNFPVITAVTGGGAQVHGTLNSLPSTQYELAFYASSACDSSGHGEGATFLGTDTVTTDGTGDATFSSSLTTSAPLGGFVTATATDPNGSTSEFSACFEFILTADLGITKDNGVTDVMPGDQVTYEIVATNTGPDDIPGAHVSDSFGVFLSCSWTCVPSGGATCTPGPSVEDIEDIIDLPVSGTATYTAVCDVDHAAVGNLENTAVVIAPTGVTDPNTGNNEAIDTDNLFELDYGDAPDPTFPTFWDSNGARHLLGGGLFLGSTVDADADGQPTAGADGDDADGSDDEDGVTFTTVAMTGYTLEMDVAVSAAGLLNAWIDFNGDGDWTDGGEQIFTDEVVAAGINPFGLVVPPSAAIGDSYARFRIDSAGGLAPDGLALDGEVEDYLIEIRYSTIDVPETGQTTSYAAGDDGAFQMGMPWPVPRFVDNGDGTVSDEFTGLMWTQDNVNPGPAPCSPGVTRNWFDSLTYVDCLNTNSYLGYDDWRMPNIVEMNSLMHFSEYDHRPWWNSQGFTMTTNIRWWSSTTPPVGLSQALTLSAFGSTSGLNKAAVTGTAVWPVRGGPDGGAVQLQATGQIRCWDASWSEVPCAGTGQDGEHLTGAAWPSPRFEVAGDCVTDRLTGLMWTKDADPFGARSWYDALDDALGISLCGFDDWRLPTVLELRSLMHHDKRGGTGPGSLYEWWESQGFVNVPNDPAWSGTSHAGDPANSAWGMFSNDSKDRDDYMVVWPVRGGLQTATADLSILMTDSADPVDPGDNITYTVNVSNLGPNPASDGVVTTTLPVGATFVGATGSGWSCGEVDLVVSCTMGSLAVGAAAPISIEITIPVLPGTMLTSTTVVDSLQDDPVGENNSAVETTIVRGYDFGDAPDPTYPTLLASDGARHVTGGGLFLGATVDNEPDGQPSALADGDDTNGADDEDGVVFTSGLGAGLNATVDITASGAGLLNAWIDLNADGDWADAGEQIFIDQALITGVNQLSYAVPVSATLGTTYARFRFGSTGGLSFVGMAADGEVEDYQVEILEGPDLEIGIAASSPFVPSGGPLTYTITVTNNGPLPATSVTVTDTLPGELIFVSSTPGTPDCTYAGDTLTCDLGTMAPTDTSQITLETVLDHPVYGTINNSSFVTAAETDPIPANNTATVDTLIALFVDGFETGDLTAWD